MPMYIKKSYKNKFPNASLLGKSGINLPSGPTLTVNQIKKVCNSIRNFFNLKINVSKNSEKIIRGINLLRLGNNPVKIGEKDILKIIS